MASQINGISQLHYWLSEVTANTMLIGPTPTIRYKRVIGISLWSGQNLTLKSHDYESES